MSTRDVLAALRALRDVPGVAPWRVGLKLHRTVYRLARTTGPSDGDDFRGIFDDREDAALVVAAVNALPALLDVVETATGADDWDHSDACTSLDGRACSCGLKALRAALARLAEVKP